MIMRSIFVMYLRTAPLMLRRRCTTGGAMVVTAQTKQGTTRQRVPNAFTCCDICKRRGIDGELSSEPKLIGLVFAAVAGGKVGTGASHFDKK